MPDNHASATRKLPNYGPVRLHYNDGPMIQPRSGMGRLALAQMEDHPNNASALARAKGLASMGKLHMGRIHDQRTEEPIYSIPELLEVLDA